MFAVPANNERVAASTCAQPHVKIKVGLSCTKPINTPTFVAFEAAGRCFGRLIEFRYSDRGRVLIDSARNRLHSFKDNNVFVGKKERERERTIELSREYCCARIADARSDIAAARPV